MPALAALLTVVALASPAPRPHIVHKLIPFPAARKRETRRYAIRHYGIHSFLLRNPKVIVEHFTETTSFAPVWSGFGHDVPDVELHELPQVCAHFVIDRDGTIYELVPPTLICRHTVGLNWTAIGIEHVGTSDADVMGNKRELRSSLALTRWLQGRYGVLTRNVIGHAESLSSPYHRERVPSLRRQTHGDMRHATMTRYRRLLREAP
jgi:N-acetylmuramoyl-L-alanine amidase